jgi:hypothetical protein
MVRLMVVICAGMYRSCSTWQYDVLAHLIERHRDGTRLGYLTGEQFIAWKARAPDWSGRWFVLKSHEGGPTFRALLGRRQARACYAFRDLRDVVYSMLRKRRVTFEAFVREGMVHQILANDRFWARRPGVLSQRYEAIIADPPRAIRELAAHFGLELEPGEAARVAAENSFEANRDRLRRLTSRLGAAGIDLSDPANAQWYDGSTLLHWNHLHQGKVGGWREHATPAERAVLSVLCDRWLAEHGYPTDACWDGLEFAERRRWTGAIRQGWRACALRRASSRYPLLARTAKRCLGIGEPPAARPVVPSLVEPAHRIPPAPHPARRATAPEAAEAAHRTAE